MTTFIAFQPSTQRAPQYAVTLDGQPCSIIMTWNFAAQRYYVNCFDQNGERVFSVPLVESPAAMPLAALSWDEKRQSATATTVNPHGFAIGAAVELTLAGCAPNAFNGTYPCVATGANTFRLPMPSNPGSAVVFGSASQLLSMTAGYFTSTMVYRARQFEVSP
jgi:hypothetical protein